MAQVSGGRTKRNTTAALKAAQKRPALNDISNCPADLRLQPMAASKTAVDTTQVQKKTRGRPKKTSPEAPHPIAPMTMHPTVQCNISNPMDMPGFGGPSLFSTGFNNLMFTGAQFANQATTCNTFSMFGNTPNLFSNGPSFSMQFGGAAQTFQAQETSMEIDDSAVVDIDYGDTDPLTCPEYVNEIVDCLRENERSMRGCIINYLSSKQRDINTGMRSILVDWLVEVSEEYKLTSDTLFLAVNYVDRFLSCTEVSRSKLQLLGVSCMLIAAKYEEIYAPAVDEFVYITDNTYKREEILAMETNVLNALGFRLTVATTKTFLRRFLKAAMADPHLAMLASYLAEMSLHEYEMVKYPPSIVAAAAVCLARHTFHLSPWTKTLSHYSAHGLEEPVMRECVGDLYQLYATAPQSSFAAIKEKYAHSKYYRASTIAPPTTPPF